MKIEFDEVCPSCHGTGLYSGFAEGKGVAIVCNTCDGTGKYHFAHEYKQFVGRVKTTKFKRVYACNPGIGLAEGNGHTLEEFGGMSYNDWDGGKPFPNRSENRKYTCPAWWYQCADYKREPKWDECYSSLGSTFPECPYFVDKNKCWERFDKEDR